MLNIILYFLNSILFIFTITRFINNRIAIKNNIYKKYNTPIWLCCMITILAIIIVEGIFLILGVYGFNININFNINKLNILLLIFNLLVTYVLGLYDAIY